MPQERILVVDDEPAIVHIWADILQEQGYAVEGMTDPVQALTRLKTEPFDLLVADIRMPELDGLTLLRMARQYDPNLTAVVITGYASIETAIEALYAGASGFVIKPVELESLVKAVEEALTQRRKEQERVRLQAQLPILQVMHTLMVAGDMDAIVPSLLEETRRALAAQRVALLLLDEAGRQLSIADALGLPQGWAGACTPGEGSTLALALSSAEPQALDLTGPFDPALRPFTEGLERPQLLLAPLRVAQRPLGLLILGAPLARPRFTPSDLNLLAIIAGQVAAVLNNARLYATVTRAKREWEATFDALDDGVSILDAELRVVRANRALAERLGTPPHELIGRPCYALLRQSETPCPACPCRTLLNEGSPRSIEWQTECLGGIFQVSAHLLGDDDSAVRGVVHVLRDITHSKRLETELIRSEKLAALGRLVASLAHEINNPLQALRSGLRLLLDPRVAPEKQRQYLQVVSREVERLIAIVERVLNFYRPSGDKAVPLDVNAIVDETLALVSKQLEHGQVSVRRESAGRLPAIAGIADQLKQVFLNIILNALQAMPAGGVLTVKTGWSKEWRRVYIAFSDVGVGIPPEELPLLFEPFHTTRPRGSGLGLAISYGIIERHGGSIQVESQVGKGSTFTVLLPATGGVN